MKKIIGIIVLVVIIVGGGFSFKYYNDTYKSENAYAVIKQAPTMEAEKDSKGQLVADSNNKQIYSYNYKVTFVFENGTTQDTDFSVKSTNKDNIPYAVGQYVKGELSKTRVNNTTLIEKSQVPQSVINKLN
ncbi:DUF1093 domain-containing protein [Holzapfeliella sp. He02]|uniref:DUF1093 domain-containing protein n=1 Tax=Holzapfeliella saturejae TaxID=3082953 RepID=A0ABU8SF64_9LACO